METHILKRCTNVFEGKDNVDMYWISNTRDDLNPSDLRINVKRIKKWGKNNRQIMISLKSRPRALQQSNAVPFNENFGIIFNV